MAKSREAYLEEKRAYARRVRATPEGLAKSRAAVDRNVDWLIAQKSQPCVDCGGLFPAVCMDFDHVRGEKLFEVGSAKSRSKAALAAEIAKCDLVCSNCHRIRTAKRGNHRGI